MTDGSYLVRVAGTPARMQLPAGAQLGAEIPLLLVGINPRPSFQIGAGPDPRASAMLTYADAQAEPDARPRRRKAPRPARGPAARKPRCWAARP